MAGRDGEGEGTDAMSYDVNLPVDGPRSREAFFAEVPAAEGLEPTRRLALGGASIGGVWGQKDPDLAVAALHDAWNAGFRLVDTAPAYRHSEEVLGAALARYGGEPPVVLTKLEGSRKHTPTEALSADTWKTALGRQFERSCDLFGRERLDGLAMHDPEGAPDSYFDACLAYLEQLKAQGRITAAGLGGGGPEYHRRLLPHAAIGYVITYLRLGAVSLQALVDTVPLAREHGAKVVVGSPIFMGLLGNRYEQHVEGRTGRNQVFIDRATRVKALADEAGLPLAQLALRFALSLPAADVVLVGAGRPETWIDSVAAYDAGPLPADLYAEIWQTAQQGEEPPAGG